MTDEGLGEIGRLRAEIAALHARVEELESALAERSIGGAAVGAAPSDAVSADAHAAFGALAWLLTPAPALIHWRPDGMVTRWSDGAERVFGWSEGEAVGRRLSELVGADPVSPDAVRALLLDWAENRFASATSEGRTKDGQARLFRWTHAVLRDDRGGAREIAAIVEDAGDPWSEHVLVGRLQLLLQLLDHSRNSIFVKDAGGRYVFVNRAHAEVLQRHVFEVIGKNEAELSPLAPEAIEEVVARERGVMAGGKAVQYEEVLLLGDTSIHFSTVKFPILDGRGETIGLGGVVTNTTSLRHAEAERAALQEKIIVAQQAALRELSTPLIPIADRVVAMPLVGTIDSARAAQIMETLLSGISSQSAHTAILDVTGVRAVDAHVADALTRTARAAQLLGTRVVLTGVRSEVAQTLVNLGVDLSGITTLGTLQSGIAHALRQLGHQRPAG
ncbi:anti-anti sigma factor protein [Sorangium cellulosum So ce56]|uniref:Anti-anti sigma factor protein n=1 Tax=Sorangium cellulosum (strain So ce56) TaxID=448385 RepID=A9G8W7_SORC5|nr:PAS domain-containing protein [Sorangium cellulosum]CAN99080.1 anti-anti sigma factor protein [Sorangium cellulosum So ce56]